MYNAINWLNILILCFICYKSVFLKLKKNYSLLSFDLTYRVTGCEASESQSGKLKLLNVQDCIPLFNFLKFRSLQVIYIRKTKICLPLRFICDYNVCLFINKYQHSTTK